MRIISGFLKGKKIDFINSKITRPIRDLVKENIFNIILHSNSIRVNLNNSNVLDLYSGTGSFGIECLSRGAKKVTFVEKDLMALFPQKNWTMLSHLLVSHGRAVCKKRGGTCSDDSICKRYCSNATTG